MSEAKIYELGQSYIHLDIKADEEFKDAFREFLLYWGKTYAKEYYKKELLEGDLFFSVEFEDGSLKSRLKFFGNLAITGLIAYGSFRTGIDYVVKDSRNITEHIVEAISNNSDMGDKILRVERRLGVPGKIKRIYKDIDNLNNNRHNLTENQQQEILGRIQKGFDELLGELDSPEIDEMKRDFNLYQIPIQPQSPNQIPESQNSETFYFPRQYMIRPKDTELVNEKDIQERKLLSNIEK